MDGLSVGGNEPLIHSLDGLMIQKSLQVTDSLQLHHLAQTFSNESQDEDEILEKFQVSFQFNSSA